MGSDVLNHGTGPGSFSVAAEFLVDGRPIFPFLEPLDWKSCGEPIRIGFSSSSCPLARVFHSIVSYSILLGRNDYKRRGLWFGTLFWPCRPCFSAAAILLQLESTARLGSHDPLC